MSTSPKQHLHRFHDVYGNPVELSNLEFFEAANNYAENLRLHRCEAPIQLPGGFRMGRCHSRSIQQCQGCASLYRGDWRNIAYSGIFDQYGALATGFRYYLVTLTAPSFGAVHHVPKSWATGNPGPWDRDGCSGCYATTGQKQWHHPEREREKAGVPVDLDSYDHAGQVAWNDRSYQLWKAFWKRVRRRWEPEKAAGFERLAHFGVKELQARMAVHFHVVIRFPVDAAPNDPEELATLAEELHSTDSEAGRVYRFGEQRDVQELTSQTTNQHGHQGHAAVVGYILKALNYTIKDTAQGTAHRKTVPGPEPEGEMAGRRMVHLARLREAAAALPCARCAGFPDGDCPAPKHHNYGIASRPFLKSQSWSFTGRTRVGCKEERAEHARQFAAGQKHRPPPGHRQQGHAMAALLLRRRPASITKTHARALQHHMTHNSRVRAAAAFQRRFSNTPVSQHGERLWNLRC